jgi:HEPN domain-containing protein
MKTSKTSKALSILPLLGGLALAGCDDGGPVGIEDLPDELTVEEALTLEVLADPTTTELALEMATAQTGAAYRRGRMGGYGEENTVRAQQRFRDAEESFQNGDLVRAMEQHREARRLVAQAMEAAGGRWALQAQVERLESLPVMVAGDPEGFNDPQGFGLQLGELAQGARNAYQKGNRVQAGQLGVLGEQATRKRQRDQSGALGSHPEVRIELGQVAIDLAWSILDEQGADDEQLDLMAVAEEFQAQAVEALEGGEVRIAAHYAHLAEWWALKAVVLPGGISDEEVQSLLALAQDLYGQAVEALGDEPDELQAALLLRAEHMLTAGEENVTNGTCRGLGALWQAAVVSSYLIGS